MQRFTSCFSDLLTFIFAQILCGKAFWSVVGRSVSRKREATERTGIFPRQLRGLSIYNCSLAAVWQLPAWLYRLRSVSLALAVGPLLTVFCLLLGRAAAVCAGDVFLLLGLGLHLAVVLVLGSFAEHDAALKNIVKVAHVCM